MRNRINKLFETKANNVLNIYFTAGFPNLEDTTLIAGQLVDNGVDLIEIGPPYSDPLADGTTIQNSSQRALENGITLAKILEQVKKIRAEQDIPIVLMGYYNQMLQYGADQFLVDCKNAGADGLIIPDLPMDEYESEYRSQFEALNLGISFLITPETSDDRIRQADVLSSSFIYVVSKSSITGGSKDMDEAQLAYFDRINKLELTTPRLIGFGIHDHESYLKACSNANGAIIGSAFIRALESEQPIHESVSEFIRRIRPKDAA